MTNGRLRENVGGRFCLSTQKQGLRFRAKGAILTDGDPPISASL